MLKKVFVVIFSIVFISSCFSNNTEKNEKNKEKKQNIEKKLDNTNNGFIIDEQEVEKKGIGAEGQSSTKSVKSDFNK